MLRSKPYAALRPTPEPVGRVASVPYDVVSTSEARARVEGNPLSFLRVVRSEVDLTESTDPHSDVVYARARENLERLKRDVLLREREPSIYLYRQQMEIAGARRSQLGVVCCSHVDDYVEGRIKRHEKTRRDKEDDRTRHTLELRANAGPVFLMYRDDPELSRLSAQDAALAPLYDFVAVDGVRHTLWRSERPRDYVSAFARVPAAYVADGHHRSASAARAAAELRKDNPAHDGSEEYNWFMSVLFPASELHILPYHRVVADLAGMSPAQLLERLREVARVEPVTDPDPRDPGQFGMYLAGRWYSLWLDERRIDRSDPVKSLDYTLLYDHVLAPILGIGDIRTDGRIDFVGGIRGTGELSRRVDAGRDAVAFAMRATSIEELFRVADAGEIMPPKSTWFEPKLRSGLVVHTLD
jgi:uncharacterized protein (DUF1015 family)